MHKAVTKEGPRAPLFYSAAVTLLLLIAGPASSQFVDVSELELCAGLETPELKLSCFEALSSGNNSPPIAEAEPVETSLADPPAAQSHAAPEVAPAVYVAPAIAAAVTPAPSPTIAATSTTTAAVVADTDFGQEYLDRPEKKQEEKEILRATVIEVTRGHNKVLYFHLDNGHVWRQMESRHFQYPKNGEFDINITRGMMGEYRMRIGDNGRMVRIRRVE